MMFSTSITDPTIRRLFKDNICSVCNLCKGHADNIDPEPMFCLMLYLTKAPLFLRAIKFIMYLQQKDMEKYSRLKTFPGFIGLFCTSTCIWKEKTCKGIYQKAACYAAFVNQKGYVMSNVQRNSICEKWGCIDQFAIGKEMQLLDGFTPDLNKKQRKKIAKTLASAHKAISDARIAAIAAETGKKYTETFYGHKTRLINGVLVSDPISVKVDRRKSKLKKKEVSTEFFHNDDKEWEETLNKYLNDTNNKKQAKTKQHRSKS